MAEGSETSGARDRVLEPRGRSAFAMRAGEVLRITDIEGQQVADLVCFNRHDLGEKLSVHVTMMDQGSIYMKKGRSLLSNHCNSLMTLVDDTCGVHDLLAGSCNEGSNFKRFGQHDTPNCRSNLEAALAPFGIPMTEIPYSFNVFMNVSMHPDGSIRTIEPVSKPGDYVDLRADMDLIVAISNCPSDQGPCNGYHLTEIGLVVRPGEAQ
ncbi:urea carboxylase-associated family protein [Lichenifustis flavocetrariae]|uniref:Urea carboxylase-associated family protein n=1 Tax=Lichenifustis flavocetrariae TaxID=2949735 RepID=A0AA41Z085_9HYPH|nr:urea carboxylase-associated family protein [Lichenifustis flavocetrariae]MCW6511811.1 urea carboxylase-associated family protein [Lichenifustis flavocetrariae]